MLDWNQIPWLSYGRRESPTEFAQKCSEQRERLSSLTYQPAFHILINATHLSAPDDLALSLHSLDSQTYPHWTAEVWAPQAWSTRLSLSEQLKGRIKWVDCARVQFAEILGRASDQSEWFVAVRGGDVLSPAALFHFALELNSGSGAELLYPQECIVDFDGHKNRVTLLSKCRDSWVSLLHFNYIGRCFAFHSRLSRRVNLVEGDEYAWLLKARGVTSEFRLVSGYWYYRNRKYSEPLFESDAQLSRAALGSFGLVGSAERHLKHTTRVVPSLDFKSHKLSVVICFRNKAQMTHHALSALLRCRGHLPLEVILVDNGSSEEESQWLRREISDLDTDLDVRVVPFSEPFNFGRMNNWAAAKHATGDVVLFLNNDVALDPTVSLDEWAGWALLPGTGTVGICLKFPDGSIQHCGIRASFGGRSHLFRVGNSHRVDSLTEVGREVFANTFAACMVRRDTFLSHGGLDSVAMANGFGDVALSLKFKRAGLKNVYLGYFSGVHAESASRGQSYEYWEEVALEHAYSDILYEMVREDLTVNLIPIAETNVTHWMTDTFEVPGPKCALARSGETYAQTPGAPLLAFAGAFANLRGKNFNLIMGNYSEKLKSNLVSSIKAKEAMLESPEQLANFEKATELVVACYKNGGRLYIAGNGGSAADAQHLAAEFVSKLARPRAPLPAEALTTDTSTLTAIGNDFGFEQVFSRQVAGKMTGKDVFLGITTSGQSQNILLALQTCKQMGISTIALSGRDGGKVKDLATVCITAPGKMTSEIQEVHQVVYHSLCACVEDALFPELQ